MNVMLFISNIKRLLVDMGDYIDETPDKLKIRHLLAYIQIYAVKI